MTRHYKVSVEKLISVAAKIHKTGYEIEAFSIIFECVRYNLASLISVKTNQPLDIQKYQTLVSIVKRNNLLNRSIIAEVRSFRQNRNKIVHQIIHNKTFDDESIGIWFEKGRTINLNIRSMIKSSDDGTYDSILNPT